jgi:hypothetical protein
MIRTIGIAIFVAMTGVAGVSAQPARPAAPAQAAPRNSHGGSSSTIAWRKSSVRCLPETHGDVRLRDDDFRNRTGRIGGMGV